MARVLIVYGTTEGHTRTIAKRIAATVMAHGNLATVVDATESDVSTRGFDACVVCGSLHLGKHQASVTHFVRNHIAFLDAVPTALFSVSLSAVLKDEVHQGEARACVDQFVEETGWRPGHVFLVAGALKYTQYDFMKRFVMRMIAQRSGGDVDTSRDFEYTDWEQLRDDTIEFLSAARLWIETEADKDELVGATT